jgi:hypothetical protein
LGPNASLTPPLFIEVPLSSQVNERSCICVLMIYIFVKMYRGGQFYWWRKPEYPKKTTDLSQVYKIVFLFQVSNGSRINLWFSNMANREKARNVDKLARVLFPVTFFLFNLIYWTVYIYVVGTCTKTKKC